LASIHELATGPTSNSLNYDYSYWAHQQDNFIIFYYNLQKTTLLNEQILNMAAVPLPPSPPRGTWTPELTAGEISKLITQYVAQIKYYENPKLWKTCLCNELWKFTKSKNHNYTQNDLLEHILKGVSKTIIDLVGGDDKFQASEVATEITQFTQYYTTVLFDYESYFGETETYQK
jgi:hypothetical protein